MAPVRRNPRPDDRAVSENLPVPRVSMYGPEVDMPSAAYGASLAGYDPDLTYYCVSGHVVSNDGDRHYVSAARVAHLYGLLTSWPNVVLVNRQLQPLISPPETYVVLNPEPSGRYLLEDAILARDVALSALREQERSAQGRSEALSALMARMGNVRMTSASSEGVTRAMADSVAAGIAAAVDRDVMDAVRAAWSQNHPVVPAQGSKSYARIVKKGCIGRIDENSEWSCDYGWSCDSCPVTLDKAKACDDHKESRLYRFLTFRRGAAVAVVAPALKSISPVKVVARRRTR